MTESFSSCSENRKRSLYLRKINLELLETLVVTMLWIKDYVEKHDIPIPNSESLAMLLKRASALIEELSNSPTDKLSEPCTHP